MYRLWQKMCCQCQKLGRQWWKVYRYRLQTLGAHGRHIVDTFFVIGNTLATLLSAVATHWRQPVRYWRKICSSLATHWRLIFRHWRHIGDTFSVIGDILATLCSSLVPHQRHHFCYWRRIGDISFIRSGETFFSNWRHIGDTCFVIRYTLDSFSSLTKMYRSKLVRTDRKLSGLQ